MVYFANSMTFLESLHQWFDLEIQEFQTIPFVQSAFSQKLTKDHYIKFLEQYYHFVGNASPMYGLAVSRIPLEYRFIRDWFNQSAFNESGHEDFILRDLIALGLSEDTVKKSIPSPSMDALIGYNFYFTLNRHPVGLLGTPYLMGKLSTIYSLEIAKKLKESLGLKGEEGTSFFFAHGHLDKEQPQDIEQIIHSITNTDIQKNIFQNAKTVFMLYQSFLRSLSA